jgi:hypothetical protein
MRTTIITTIKHPTLLPVLLACITIVLPVGAEAEPSLDTLDYQYQADKPTVQVKANLIQQINVLDYCPAPCVTPATKGMALIEAIKGVNGGTPTLYLPAGDYQVEQSIDATNKISGLRLVGDGQDRTVIRGGALGQPLLDLSASKYVQLSDLTVKSEVASCIVLFARGCAPPPAPSPDADEEEKNAAVQEAEKTKAGCLHDAPAAGNARLTRVKVKGDASVAGICNIGSEVNYFDRVVIHMTGSEKEIGYFNDRFFPDTISSQYIPKGESSNVASVWIQPLIQIDSNDPDSRAMEFRNHRNCTMIQPRIITQGASAQIVGQNWDSFIFLGGAFEAANDQAVSFRLFESDMKGRKYNTEEDNQGIDDLRYFSLIGVDFLGIQGVSCGSDDYPCSGDLDPSSVQGFRATGIFVENSPLGPAQSTLLDIDNSRSAHIRAAGARVKVSHSSRGDAFFELDEQSELADAAMGNLGSISRRENKQSTRFSDLAQRAESVRPGAPHIVSDRVSLVWAVARVNETATIRLRSAGRNGISKTIRLAAPHMHDSPKTSKTKYPGTVVITDMNGATIDGATSCTLTGKQPHVTLGLIHDEQGTASWIVLSGGC